MMLLASGSVMDTVLHHVQDGTALDLFGFPVPIPESMLAWGITKLVIYQWIVAAFTIVFFVTVARGRTTGVPSGLYGAVEAFLVALQKIIAEPLLGKKDAITWSPYLWSLFVVIWFNNLCGLLPMGATATGHLKVTAGFALLTLLLIHLTAASHGPKGYFKAMVPTVPLVLFPMMLVLELVGYCGKCMSLAIRLFANMLAGHIILLTILSFILMFGEAVAIIAVPGAIAIFFLEIFVATLQAFIFTFLTTVFIGGMLHPHH